VIKHLEYKASKLYAIFWLLEIEAEIKSSW